VHCSLSSLLADLGHSVSSLAASGLLGFVGS